MTVMLVPHSQKSVYRFRINYYFVLFSIILLGSIIALSMVASVRNSEFNETRAQELASTQIWENQMWLVEEKRDALKGKARLLYIYGNEFYNSIWGKTLNPELLESLSSFGEKEQLNELTAEGLREYIEPINRALDFMLTREEKYQDLPLGWPIESGVITSEYGHRLSPFGLSIDLHTGYDFANAIGTPIKATADGEVIYSGFSNSGYGMYVKILHKNGFVSMYAHASAVIAKESQMVKRGDVIALLGRSGSATGPHVHYEIRLLNRDPFNYFDVALNPLPYIREKL